MRSEGEEISSLLTKTMFATVQKEKLFGNKVRVFGKCGSERKERNEEASSFKFA
jgi:hypothetical protein